MLRPFPPVASLPLVAFHVLLAFVLAGPLAATTLRPVEVNCPVCEEPFIALRIGSTNTAGGSDPDLCPHPGGEPTVPYHVWTCPSCGYSRESRSFEEAVDESIARFVREDLEPPFELEKGMTQRQIPGWAKYALAASIAEASGAEPARLARLFLLGAWSERLQFLAPLSDRLRAASERPAFARVAAWTDERSTRIEEDTQETDPYRGMVALGRALLAGRLDEETAEEAIWRELCGALYLRLRGENAEARSALDRLAAREGIDEAQRFLVESTAASIERERRLQRQALEWTRRALDAGAYDGGERVHQLFVVGELLRHLEDRGAAAAFREALDDEALDLFSIPRIEAGLERVGDPYRIGDERRRAVRQRTIDRQIERLNDPETAGNAALILGDLADPSSTDGILAALGHPNSGVRWFAAGALRQVPDPDGRVVRALSGLLADDDDPGPRWKAATVLAQRADRKSVAALQAALDDSSRNVREEALRGLGRIGDPSAYESILAVLTGGEGSDRFAAIEALGMLADPRAIEPLLEAWPDTIEEWGDGKRVADLIATALSRITATRFWTAEPSTPATCAAGHERFRTWCEDHRAGPTEAWVRDAFDDAGRPLPRDLDGPETRDVLIEALADENPVVRHHAFRILRERTGQSFALDDVLSWYDSPRSRSEWRRAVRQWKDWAAGEDR